jgi:hypothetical protein
MSEDLEEQGKVEAIEMVLREVILSMKKNNRPQYNEIKESCKENAHQMVVCMGEIGEDDIEIKAHAYAQQVISLFDDPTEHNIVNEFEEYVYNT